MYDHCVDGLIAATGDFHGAPNFTNCSNSTLAEPEWDEQWPLERVVSMVVPVFFGLIGLAGLLGNALVILVVVANQQMRSTTNLLIINLAISDILFVIFCVPFTATDYVLPEWPFGNLWCKFVQYMIVVTCHCSVYTLVLMSFDRFLAVVHPVTSMSLRTERNAMLAIVFAWVLIVTTAIPVALSHGVRIYRFRGHNYTACVFSSQQEIWSLVGFQVSFFLSSYVLPLTLISFLYVGMLARLWKSAPGCKPSAESRKGKRRVTRMVVVVVLAFAVCWLPIHVILVLKSLDLYGSSHVTVIIQIVSHVLAYTNSCINPILYAFLSDNFRKAFRKVKRKRKFKEDIIDITEEENLEEYIIPPSNEVEANKNRKNSNYQGEGTNAPDNLTDIVQAQKKQSQPEDEFIVDAFAKSICMQIESITKSESHGLMNEV